jgi:RNA polymerase sigma-70 factor (ECF subfamily)
MPTPPLPHALAALISGTDDADLLVRLRRKDPSAIGLLYDRYGKTAYSLAFGILRHTEEAESVVAESVLKCWNRISSFRQARGSAIGAWLLLTTYLTTRDRLRGRSPNHDDWSGQPSPLEQGSLFHGWSKELDGDHMQSLFIALQKLDGEERRVLDMAFFEGMTLADLTASLGYSTSELDHLISSALAALRTCE